MRFSCHWDKFVTQNAEISSIDWIFGIVILTTNPQNKKYKSDKRGIDIAKECLNVIHSWLWHI